MLKKTSAHMTRIEHGAKDIFFAGILSSPCLKFPDRKKALRQKISVETSCLGTIPKIAEPNAAQSFFGSNPVSL